MTHISPSSSLSPSIDSEGESETHSDEEEVSSIEVRQTVSPGNFDSVFTYILDWEAREATVPIFGHIIVRARYIPLSDIQDKALQGRLEITGGAKMAIEEIVKSPKGGWETRAVWGFEEIDGQRRYTRNCVTEKEEEKLSVRFVYDYLRDGEA
jgi:hypothetical protein